MTEAAPEPVTLSARIGLGLAFGAAAGAALSAAGSVAATIGARGASALSTLPGSFLAAWLAWFVGLMVVGAPVFWLLQRLRLAGWRAVVTVGGVLSFVAAVVMAIPSPMLIGRFSIGDAGGMTIIDNHLTAHGWAVALRGALANAIAGSAATAVAWLVAIGTERRI
jgi:hypothetical protein